MTPKPAYSVDSCNAPQRPRPPRRESGVVMVIAIFAIVLLAALVFYVFNTGRHIAQRIETQNAADNAALSGAGWVARSLNTVAMNNVEIARMIALVNVMDSMPMAIEHTLEDQIAVLTAIDAQIASGVGSDSWVADGLAEARDTIAEQIDLLQPLDELLNQGDYDIAAMTFYESSSGERGDLWEAIESLSALSQATMENLGLLAQQNAYRGAQIAQRDSGFEAGGLLLPWTPTIPWEQGVFEDFERPVIDGLLPEGQDDPEISRGPYDTLFGFWRIGSFADYETIEVTIEQDYSLLGWAPYPSSERITNRTANHYSTWGAFDDMKRSAMDLGINPDTGGSAVFAQALSDPADAERHPLVPSFWSRRVNLISDQKINYVFPGSASENVVRDPVWITDFDAANAILQDQGSEIAYRLYLVLTYESNDYAGITPATPTLQSWGLSRRSPDSSGTTLIPRGLEQIADHIWRDERRERGTDAAGETFTKRYQRYYVFLGVNIGEEVTVRNPNNFEAADRENLPGPINFPEDAEFLPEDDLRRDSLSFLGIAHQPKAASFWASGFDEGRVDTKHVGLAQAEVFNNHSWDLWTQMWQAQLVPIDGLVDSPDAGSSDPWIEQLENPQSTDQMPWLDDSDLTDVTEYLRAVAPLSELMLEH